MRLLVDKEHQRNHIYGEFNTTLTSADNKDA